MSLPAAAVVGAGAGAPLSAIGTITIAPIDAALMALNSNPYFIGTMMLMLNLGGRFIAMEVTKSQEQFFQNPWVRRVLNVLYRPGFYRAQLLLRAAAALALVPCTPHCLATTLQKH